MDIRFICADCGTKWFARSGEESGDRLVQCAACDGPLVELAGSSPDPVRDAYGAAHRPQCGSG